MSSSLPPIGLPAFAGFPIYAGQPDPEQPRDSDQPGAEQRIVIIGPDHTVLGTSTQVPDGGQIAAAVAHLDQDEPQAPAVDTDPARPQRKTDITEIVEEPAKVMRIGSMVKQLLDEVKSAPLDEAGRTRMREIHATSITELESGLSAELVAELHRLHLPFGENSVPSEAELRIAQAQLVGWLEGLFHGIQTAIIAQQMSARAQMEAGLRRALPGGSDSGPSGGATGQYL